MINKSVSVPTHCGQVLFPSRITSFGMRLKVRDKNGNGWGKGLEPYFAMAPLLQSTLFTEGTVLFQPIKSTLMQLMMTLVNEWSFVCFCLVRPVAKQLFME